MIFLDAFFYWLVLALLWQTALRVSVARRGRRPRVSGYAELVPASYVELAGECGVPRKVGAAAAGAFLSISAEAHQPVCCLCWREYWAHDEPCTVGPQLRGPGELIELMPCEHGEALDLAAQKFAAREQDLLAELGEYRAYAERMRQAVNRKDEEIHGLRKAYAATRANLAAECGQCVEVTTLGGARREFRCTGRGRACSASLRHFQLHTDAPLSEDDVRDILSGGY